MPATTPTPQTTARTTGRPSMKSGELASRNRRWLQMRDELRMPIAEIATLARKTRRTIQQGIRAARHAHKPTTTNHPEAPPDGQQLTPAELGSLSREIKGNVSFQTPEVLDWLARLRSDRRRPERPGRE